MIYAPAEDSYLLQKYVKRYAKGSVLDIGAGSGIQALTAAKKEAVSKVTAVDIDEKAIQYCRNTIKNRKITFKKSDLFSSIKGRFDTVIFNPPYLPALKGETETALSAAKHGYEIIERFIKDLSSHLAEKGIILLIFSSLTNKKKVDEIISNFLFQSKDLEKLSFFFEKIYCYKIIRSSLLKKIEKLDISKVRLFSKGRRGVIFKGRYKNKDIAIKIKRDSSYAKDTVNKEHFYLRLLNKRNIGPKLLFKRKDFVVMEFISGAFIKDYIADSGKKDILSIIAKILDQLYLLDTLHLSKEEMHKPLKHIIIKNKRPILIDFERMHKTDRPKNITQFIQFILNMEKDLKSRGISLDKEKLIQLSRSYKHDPTEETFGRIKKELQR